MLAKNQLTDGPVHWMGILSVSLSPIKKFMAYNFLCDQVAFLELHTLYMATIHDLLAIPTSKLASKEN